VNTQRIFELTAFIQLLIWVFFAGRFVQIVRDLQTRTAKLEKWREQEAALRERLWREHGVDRRHEDRRHVDRRHLNEERE
jgi:hypothetical protein